MLEQVTIILLAAVSFLIGSKIYEKTKEEIEKDRNYLVIILLALAFTLSVFFVKKAEVLPIILLVIGFVTTYILNFLVYKKKRDREIRLLSLGIGFASVFSAITSTLLVAYSLLSGVLMSHKKNRVKISIKFAMVILVGGLLGLLLQDIIVPAFFAGVILATIVGHIF